MLLAASQALMSSLLCIEAHSFTIFNALLGKLPCKKQLNHPALVTLHTPHKWHENEVDRDHGNTCKLQYHKIRRVLALFFFHCLKVE